MRARGASARRRRVGRGRSGQVERGRAQMEWTPRHCSRPLPSARTQHTRLHPKSPDRGSSPQASLYLRLAVRTARCPYGSLSVRLAVLTARSLPAPAAAPTPFGQTLALRRHLQLYRQAVRVVPARLPHLPRGHLLRQGRRRLVRRRRPTARFSAGRRSPATRLLGLRAVRQLHSR